MFIPPKNAPQPLGDQEPFASYKNTLTIPIKPIVKFKDVPTQLTKTTTQNDQDASTLINEIE